ncbi:MAG: hypothetical protein JHC31_10990 [Sulfurihydrogenibium sp.]|nr:hypothetical protein [Sulfurihydrogenibium sp.]
MLLSVAVITSACHKKNNYALQGVDSKQTVVTTYYLPQTNLEQIDEEMIKVYLTLCMTKFL